MIARRGVEKRLGSVPPRQRAGSRGMTTFHDVTPARDSLGRGIVLFGRHVASYRFALPFGGIAGCTR